MERLLKHSERDLPDNRSEHKSFEVRHTFVEDGLQYSAIKEVENIHKPIMIFIALKDTAVLPKETEKIIAKANNPFVIRQEDMGHDFRDHLNQCQIVMEKIENFLRYKRF